jgi:5-methyltetrahydrofolate--homocysteine methyltransferase
MKTVLKSPGHREVIIGDDQPTVLIGERIHPFGKGPVKEALQSGNFKLIRDEALSQVQAGADALIVNANVFGMDECDLLPRVVRSIMETTDIPLCLESRNPLALEKTLQLGCGRPMISSVTGERQTLDSLLPIIKAHDLPVVVMATDSAGIPTDPHRRIEIVKNILRDAEALGIPRVNLVIDCLAESIAVSAEAARITCKAIERVRNDLGMNTILGASNISFGLPNRSWVNIPFLSLAIASGLTSAIVNVKVVKPYVTGCDLLMGKDRHSRRYMAYYRSLNKGPDAKGE